MVKNLPEMQETWVRSLGQEDPLVGLGIHGLGTWFLLLENLQVSGENQQTGNCHPLQELLRYRKQSMFPSSATQRVVLAPEGPPPAALAPGSLLEMQTLRSHQT